MKNDYLILALGVLLLIALGVGGYLYLQEAKARAALEAQLTVYQAQLSALDAKMALNDKQALAAVQKAQMTAAAVKTPQQAIASLPEFLGLQKPIYLPLPTPSAPTPDAVIPREDILPLFNRLELCKENDILLGQCKLDRELLTQKTDILTKERDQAVATVRGGTFWTRVKRNVRWIAVVGAVGFTSYEIGTRH